MTRADGTACARLPVFPPGFPVGVFPLTPLAALPAHALLFLMHVSAAAEHVRLLLRGNVCTHARLYAPVPVCVCVLERVQFVK